VMQLDLLDYTPPPALRRDAAIASVASHSEENQPGWSEIGFRWVCRYAEIQAEFLAEECVAASIAAGVRQPTNSKAWSGPVMRAAREHFIRKNGYAPSPKRNLSPTVSWQSCHSNFARSARG
jgi:hypothetical protein